MWMDNIDGIDLFVIIDGEITYVGLKISFLTQDRRQEHNHTGVPLINLRIGRMYPGLPTSALACLFIELDDIFIHSDRTFDLKSLRRGNDIAVPNH